MRVLNLYAGLGGNRQKWEGVNVTAVEYDPKIAAVFELWGVHDIPSPPNFINHANKAEKKALQDWLGIHYEENIYYDGNHCPSQILRNCVHPDLGLQVFERMKAA